MTNEQLVKELVDMRQHISELEAEKASFKKQVEQLRQTITTLKQERTMFISGPVVIFKWLKEQNWPVEYVSPNVKDVLDYSVAEFLSGLISYPEIIHRDDIKRVANEIAENSKIDIERFEHKPYRVKRKDSKVIWVADVTTIMRNTKGTISHFFSYIFDITRQVMIEKALESSEQKYRLVLENANEAIIIVQDGRHKFFNPKILEITGYSNEEYSAKSIFEIIHPGDRKRVIDQYDKRLRGEKVPQSYEVRFVDKSGNTKWVLINAVLLEWEGKPATLALITDLTKRKRAGQTIERFISLLEATLESTDDGIVVIDKNGILSKTNNRFADIWRITEPIKATWDYKKLLDSIKSQLVNHEIFFTKMEELMAEPEADCYDRVELVDRRTLEYYSQPQRISGKSVGRVWSFRDITERKRAEDLIRIQRDLGVALGTTTDMMEALNLLLDATFRIDGIDCGSVYFLDNLTGELHLQFQKGFSIEFISATSHYSAASAHARLVMAKKPIYRGAGELLPTMDKLRQAEGLTALAVLPVLHENNTIAMLHLASHTIDNIPASARDALESIAAHTGGIIARIRAEAAVRENEKKYRELTNSLPLPAFEFNMELKVTFANKIAFEHFGYSPEDLQKGFEALQILIPEDRERAYHNIKRVLNGEMLDGVNYTARRKDETTFPVVIYSSAIVHDNKPVGIRGIIIDMSKSQQYR